MLTPRESQYCADIAGRIERVRGLLKESTLSEPVVPEQWYSFLSSLRHIQGNLSNDLSFVATLLAKKYLLSKFSVAFDAAEKPQGAPGIDIDVTAEDGERIVGEIKTTVPYQGVDFGAQQLASFKKDFAKLTAADAAHKFLFVSDPGAFTVLRKPKYTAQMPGVHIVLLTTGEEHVA